MYETWEEECVAINGYNKFQKSAQKKEGLKKGRKAGGLVVYVKTSVKKVEILSNGMNEVLWLKLNAENIMLLIGTVYRQPSQSNYYNERFFPQLLE